MDARRTRPGSRRRRSRSSAAHSRDGRALRASPARPTAWNACPCATRFSTTAAASGAISRPDAAERDQRAIPAEMREQPLRQRQQRELTERARGRRDAERHAALLGWKRAAQHACDDAERHPGQAGADQHARRQHESTAVSSDAPSRRAPARTAVRHPARPGLRRIGRRPCRRRAASTPHTRFCTAIASANVSRVPVQVRRSSAAGTGRSRGGCPWPAS